MKNLAWSLPLLVLAVAGPALAAPAKTIHLEAEDGQLNGPTVATQRLGYTGTGYVTGFTKPTDNIVLTIPNAKAGVYDVHIHYWSGGVKGYDLVVNGAKYSGLFQPSGDSFATQDAGDVLLQDGANTVGIDYGWGWYEIDNIDLIPATIPSLARPPAAPADPQATPAARALKAYLAHQYGMATLSGQYDPEDTQYVRTTTGKLPAILGGDFMDYSPSRIAFGATPSGLPESMIAAAKAGQIITLSWHWNAPADLVNRMDKDANGNPVNHMWYKGFYTNASTFDVEKAVDNPGSPDYQLLLRDMDAIAVQLQKISDAGVPVLWRPLHEAEGGWFWWGAKGPEPFKKLWRLMFDRFTNYHHLHNLIWVYSSGTDPKWYPGDQYVDVVGIDAYPSDITDPIVGTWKQLQSEYAGRKLVAITEFGGAPDVPKMRQLGARWSYFVSWPGTANENPPDALKAIYDWPTVVTADKLPAPVR